MCCGCHIVSCKLHARIEISVLIKSTVFAYYHRNSLYNIAVIYTAHETVDIFGDAAF